MDTLLELRLDVSKNTVVRKLHLKLTQRLGQALLPPRIAKWRYTRGRRVLLKVAPLARVSPLSRSLPPVLA